MNVSERIAQLTARLQEAENEMEASYVLVQRQGKLLTGVVNALKGEPPDDTSWSHHDAPELAAKMVERLERLRTQLQLTENAYQASLTLQTTLLDRCTALENRLIEAQSHAS